MVWEIGGWSREAEQGRKVSGDVLGGNTKNDISVGGGILTALWIP